MPRIRTDLKALAIAFVFAAAFQFFCLRNGLTALPEGMRSWDLMAIWLAAAAAIYSAVFVAGHLALRALGAGKRAFYAGLGAVSLSLTHAALSFGQVADAFLSGVGFSQFILPGLLGAAFGFLYAHRAGWEPGEGGVIAGDDDSLVAHGGDTYFDGPVQVRTSIPVMILAAVVGSILVGLVRGAMTIGWEVSLLDDPSARQALDHAFDASAYAGLSMVAMGIIGVPVMTVAILAGHYLARAFRRNDYGVYFGIGLLAPVILALATMFLFAGVALMIALPNAVAMVVYRKLAGLEPVPVREDIIAERPRDLVGPEHLQRRMSRVVGGRRL